MSQDSAAELSEDVVAGQAVYSKRVLKIYDVLVLGISNRLIWKCRTKHLLSWYHTHLSGNHLDVGVGTGYFLEHGKFPVESPRVALMDLNANCLEVTAERLQQLNPVTYPRNILEPIPFEEPPFDSIGLNYVLHCLPGKLTEKSCVFDHLLPLLNPGGCLFGSTLLASGVKRNWSARQLMKKYNERGIFSNAEDALSDLDAELQQRFVDVKIEVRGCGALFAAQKSE